jgi:hypothetical protein
MGYRGPLALPEVGAWLPSLASIVSITFLLSNGFPADTAPDAPLHSFTAAPASNAYRNTVPRVAPCGEGRAFD